MSDAAGSTSPDEYPEPIKCTLCDQTFTVRGSIAKHLTDDHGLVVPDDWMT